MNDMKKKHWLTFRRYAQVWPPRSFVPKSAGQAFLGVWPAEPPGRQSGKPSQPNIEAPSQLPSAMPDRFRGRRSRALPGAAVKPGARSVLCTRTISCSYRLWPMTLRRPPQRRAAVRRTGRRLRPAAAVLIQRDKRLSSVRVSSDIGTHGFTTHAADESSPALSTRER